MPRADQRNVPDWRIIERQVIELAHEESHWLPVLANTSALLSECLEDVNWVGFYVTDAFLGHSHGASELVLGPFQGKVACVHIPLGRGVCGTAAARNQTLRIDDVHAFKGHIVCDAASRSEIVVPLEVKGEVVGVLDIDSPSLSRFGSDDQRGLEACVRALSRASAFGAR
jgi:GAF domain-containing protein